MIVEELIEKLKSFPLGAVVMVLKENEEAVEVMTASHELLLSDCEDTESFEGDLVILES